jgi:hypothetical protein
VGAGPPALKGGTFSVGQPAPDAVLLVRVHRKLEARRYHRAMTADRFCVLFTRFFLDLGFGLVGTEKYLNVVLTTKSIFLPIQLLNKFSGVQQGNARLLRKDRRSLRLCSRPPVISPRAAGGSTAVPKSLPSPGFNNREFAHISPGGTSTAPYRQHQDCTQGTNRHPPRGVPRWY